MITADELRLLSIVTAEVLCNKDYINLLDKILIEYVDLDDAFIDYVSYIVTVPQDKLAIALDHFMILPLESMPEYLKHKPFDQLKPASSFCPPASEGPYPWQAILAKWRMNIQK